MSEHTQWQRRALWVFPLQLAGAFFYIDLQFKSANHAQIFHKLNGLCYILHKEPLMLVCVCCFFWRSLISYQFFPVPISRLCFMGMNIGCRCFPSDQPALSSAKLSISSVCIVTFLHILLFSIFLPSLFLQLYWGRIQLNRICLNCTIW